MNDLPLPLTYYLVGLPLPTGFLHLEMRFQDSKSSGFIFQKKSLPQIPAFQGSSVKRHNSPCLKSWEGRYGWRSPQGQEKGVWNPGAPRWGWRSLRTKESTAPGVQGAPAAVRKARAWHPKPIWQFWKLFWLSWQEGATLTWLEEVRDVANHPAMHRTAPPNQELSSLRC